MTFCVHLAHRALVEVSGPDRTSFLQGLLSQDVETLAPGEVRYGALLAPQGRLLFDLLVIGRPEAIWLEVEAARRDDMLARLRIYKLRAKVEIRPLEAEAWVAWPDAPGPDWVADPRRPGLAFRGPRRPRDRRTGGGGVWSSGSATPRILTSTGTIPSNSTSTWSVGSTSPRAASWGRRRPPG